MMADTGILEIMLKIMDIGVNFIAEGGRQQPRKPFPDRILRELIG
jgi:hypothetical protein